MTRRALMVLTIVVFAATALGIAVLVLLPQDFFRQDRALPKTRIVIPQSDGNYDPAQTAERLAYEDSMNAKVPLEEGETIVAVLPLGDGRENTEEEDQIVAYRNPQELESPIYITYIHYNRETRTHKRVWNAPSAVTRPGTLNLFSQDLVGDRSVCVLVTGMNGSGEYTMTVFRRSPAGGAQGFQKIAEIRIEGSIMVLEQERSHAYQMGQTRGQSFAIAAYGRDYESANILDQVEITYVYNPVNGLYEQSRIARVPGIQIEQRRVRELLSGSSREFEDFINGLWYHISSEGTVDNRQYLYFDPRNREIIFYSDDTQEVFSWKNSTPTRYGLYVSSQNISITNLRRFLNIELESLDSIQVKLFEDVHLRIMVSGSWNGSYRKVRAVESPKTPAQGGIQHRFQAQYDGTIGKLAFYEDGSYTLQGREASQWGKYSFFALDDKQLLELRNDGGGRETFLVEGTNPQAGRQPALYGNLTLSRVRLGTKGIQELHEAAISLALSQG